VKTLPIVFVLLAGPAFAQSKIYSSDDLNQPMSATAAETPAQALAIWLTHLGGKAPTLESYAVFDGPTILYGPWSERMPTSFSPADRLPNTDSLGGEQPDTYGLPFGFLAYGGPGPRSRRRLGSAPRRVDAVPPIGPGDSAPRPAIAPAAPSPGRTPTSGGARSSRTHASAFGARRD
jgi:hypothetical protein